MGLHEAWEDIHKSIVASSPRDVSPLASVSRKLRLRKMWEKIFWSSFSCKVHGRRRKDIISFRAIIRRDPLREAIHLGWCSKGGIKRTHGTRDFAHKTD